MRTGKRWVLDIETLADFFCTTFIDYDSDEVKVFEISSRKDEGLSLKSFLRNHVKTGIGFNNNHFDNIVIGHLLKNALNKPEDLYRVAQITINQENDYDSFKPYSYYKYNPPYRSIDLFLYWSKGLRISKKLSLKVFANNLDMNIEEMPIHHTRTNLTSEEMDMVINYNINDVRVTKELCKRLKEDINLRMEIEKEYGIPCISYDAPKIASEILLNDYCIKNRLDKDTVRKRRYVKKDFVIGDYLPELNFKTELFQQIHQEVCKSVNTFSKEVLLKQPNGQWIKSVYGIGGLHTVNKEESYKSTEKVKVVDLDVQSMYPQFIINYKLVSPELGEGLLTVYIDIKGKRVVAKQQKIKSKDDLYKLILNGFSGLEDSEYNWLYAPEQAVALRIMGQLFLTRLTEELNLNSISVVSQNTDGCTFLLPIELEDRLTKNIIPLIEREFNCVLERTDYQWIHYKTVNDYIALTTDGKIKTKGEFVYGNYDEKTKTWSKILDASNEFRVLPWAWMEYFVNGVSVEQTITNHSNIYDFCKAQKIDKKFSVWYKGQKQQQLNRYFVSDRKNGAYLYKSKDGQNMLNLMKDTPVYILNQSTDKPAQEFPIDYNYYIQRAKEQIQLFEKQQLTLF